MNRARPFSALVGTILAIVPSAAGAGQTSASMQVTLTVQPTCRVSASPLAFAGEAGHAIEAEARIAVDCNGDIPVAVSLDGGTHLAGGERRLAGEGRYVPYTLYSDAGRRFAWAAGHPLMATARDGRIELAAYGRVEADAAVEPGGTYEDTIAITVDF